MFRAAATAAVLILAASCSKEAPPPELAATKQMIWEVLKAYHDAGDKADVASMKKLLAPEVSLVVAHDDVVRGYDAVVKTLTDRVKTYEGTPRSTITGKEVISVTGDVALVTYIASVETHRGLITAVLRRTKDGAWQIAHLHDTWSMPSKK